MKEKYITDTIGKIITRISTKTDIPGYTHGVIESFICDPEELTEKEVNQWIKENNKRMKAICKFLNENDL